MAKGKDSRRREEKKPKKKKAQVYITQETRFYISPTVCGQNYIYPLGVGMGVGGVCCGCRNVIDDLNTCIHLGTGLGIEIL